ncbi:NUDIX domain-containing protein [Pelagibacteraceae bacterium]|nr:NUDIX domain-containing protein [Pelagibacteraceae bacterium]
MSQEEYRRGVGMVVINYEKKIFIGQRLDKDQASWQMPQGGIDENESPEETCIRELAEETGIVGNYKILDKTQNGTVMISLKIFKNDFGEVNIKVKFNNGLL